MEYKFLSYDYEVSSYDVNISTHGQMATREENPAIDRDLNKYARDGWRVVTAVFNGSNDGVCFLLERNVNS